MINQSFLMSLIIAILIFSPLTSLRAMDAYTIEEERKVTALQPQFRLMKMYINSFEAYTEQVKNYLRGIYESIPEHEEYASIKALLNEKVRTQERNINWAKKVEKSIFDLNAGEMTPSKLLEEWLGNRFICLAMNQEENNKNSQAFRIKDLNTFLGLADENYPKLLQTEQDGEFIAKLEVKTSNDQFTLFNHLIVSLYNITPRDQLSPKVKRMLSASQNLWPLLLGQTDESLDIDSSFPDFEYYDNCIKRRVRVEVILMNHMQTKMVILETAEEAGLTRLELPKPDWLYGSRKDRDAPQTRNKSTFLEGTIVKDVSASKRKKKKQPPKVKTEQEEGVKQQKAVEVASIVMPIRGESATTEELVEVINPNPVQEPIKEVKEAELPARGNRLFHFQSMQEESHIEKTRFAKELTARWHNLLETIFDNTLNGQGFCFRDVELLWERLHGKGSVRSTGRGSSHRVFMWDPRQDGNFVVAGSTFAHGPNHRYTSKTVRYIRDAFREIGYPWEQK